MRDRVCRGLVLGLLVLLACCVNPVSPEKNADVRSIWVLPALGEEVTFMTIGIKNLGNDEQTALDEPWKIHESVVRRISSLLGKRFAIRPVTCDRTAFRAAGTFDTIGDVVRKNAVPQGLDAYVVVTPFGAPVGNSNQEIRGL